MSASTCVILRLAQRAEGSRPLHGTFEEPFSVQSLFDSDAVTLALRDPSPSSRLGMTRLESGTSHEGL